MQNVGMAGARMRAYRTLRDAGLDESAGLERVSSALNEVWFTGPYVVRVNPTPGTHRLGYEAELAAHLPAEVKYPEIVAYGKSPTAEWLVLERVPGIVLSRAWPTMTEAERRDAVWQLAEALRSLHATGQPVNQYGPIRAPFLDRDTLECPHQLPASRVLTLLGRAARLRFVDAGLVSAAAELVESTASAFDGDDKAPGLVHGDAHFENVLWESNSITAILDFEWSRPAPADIDLDMILRFCADPSLHVATDYGHLANARDYLQVPVWLKAAYPELFGHPRLRERLMLYDLAYDVRHLLLHPPTGAINTLSPHHALRRIRRTIDGRNHLGWMEI
jgi:aminoglycoside phosphotransferase (APT) family kinase protein